MRSTALLRMTPISGVQGLSAYACDPAKRSWRALGAVPSPQNFSVPSPRATNGAFYIANQ